MYSHSLTSLSWSRPRPQPTYFLKYEHQLVTQYCNNANLKQVLVINFYFHMYLMSASMLTLRPCALVGVEEAFGLSLLSDDVDTTEWDLLRSRVRLTTFKRSSRYCLAEESDNPELSALTSYSVIQFKTETCSISFIVSVKQRWNDTME